MAMLRKFTLGLMIGLLLGMAPAQAQLIFGGRLEDRLFSGQDTRIIGGVLQDLLNTGTEGAQRPWSNPENGHSGMVALLRSFEANGRPCRDVKIDNRTGRQTGAATITVCRIEDGAWRIAG